MTDKLKLYVWENVLCDYTCGVVFAYASSIEEAIGLIKDEDDIVMNTANVKIYDNEPMALVLWGGG